MPKKSIGSLELMNNFLGLLQWQLEVVVDLDNPKSNWTNFFVFVLLVHMYHYYWFKKSTKTKNKINRMMGSQFYTRL